MLAYAVIKFFEDRAARRARERTERAEEVREARAQRLEEKSNEPSRYLLKIWAEGAEHPDYEAYQKDKEALLCAKFGLSRREAATQISRFYDSLP